jgi:hypothetical protein
MILLVAVGDRVLPGEVVVVRAVVLERIASGHDLVAQPQRCRICRAANDRRPNALRSVRDVGDRLLHVEPLARQGRRNRAARVGVLEVNLPARAVRLVILILERLMSAGDLICFECIAANSWLRKSSPLLVGA